MNQIKIPRINGFWVYRISKVDLAEEDRPTGMTYTPDPLPQARYLGGPPEVKATHLKIHGLNPEWKICRTLEDLYEIYKQNSDSLWYCGCAPAGGGGTIAVSIPTKYEIL